MIRGYFHTRGGKSRPYVPALFQFPSLENQTLETRLLVDTGADRTLLAPRDCKRLIRRFGLDLTSLATTATGTGIGGRVNMRTLEAVLTLPPFSTALTLTVLAPEPGSTPAIPSLLGRDVLSHFALFMEERTGQLLLLEPEEAREIGIHERLPFT